jgi:hypothetical protein
VAKDRTDESEEAVERGLEQIQRTHRGRIRWGIGKQTAELALRALDDSPTNRRHRRSAKSRRRKRHKRLL